jgi:signal transduction histidine kinase/ActR/RegA family two-component response regulator
MKRIAGQFARARETQAMIDVGLSPYHMTLSGFVQPLWFHAVFNALTAVTMTLLGHPLLAAGGFVASCAIDVLNVSLARRRLAGPPATSDAVFNGLIPICVLRMSVYVAPPTWLALTGGTAELVFFGIQAVTLWCVSMSLSMSSRRVYGALATPVAVAMGVVAWSKLSGWAGVGVGLALATTTLLLALVMEGLVRTVQVLHKAYNANVALIPELETARDQALVQRAAADAAREEARQASRAKANFLATMSHEIRTPMNGVLGMAQLMRRDAENATQAHRLEVLIESGEYLLSILNDILDVSKIDAGRLDILPAPEDLHLFLQRLVSFWGAQADAKGVSLILDVSASVPQHVMIDALRLRQVLFNLVGNALKFTEDGAVELSARAAPEGEGAVRLELIVKDTGIGIAAHSLPHLFDRFRQADDTESRRFGGTGLGLAIAKQLVELMGGRISAESVVGHGSTFHIELPLALAEAPTAPVSAEPEKPEPSTALKVLAVDDNAVNLLVLEQILGSLGHHVAKAGSGHEALAALQTEAFDLVLMDIQMPGMSGVDVLARLRADEGPNRQAPVIALTADVTSGGRKRYLGIGFTEHTPKPIQIPDLVAAMSRAMDASPRAASAA